MEWGLNDVGAIVLLVIAGVLDVLWFTGLPLVNITLVKGVPPPLTPVGFALFGLSIVLWAVGGRQLFELRDASSG